MEESSSPYSSPIVIVKKKDGSNRFCVDYRAINRITLFDAEPMADPDTIFSRLTNCMFISKFDLSKGYWQVPLTEFGKDVSAFSVPSGHFQFVVMPFGMVNSPATFCKMMRKILHGAKDLDHFMDDVIAGTVKWRHHLEVIRDFLERLRENGLTAKPSKTFIGYTSQECLGFHVGEGLLKPTEDKVRAIVEAPAPKTKKQVRSFLGLSGFYRRFVPNYAAIATPLTELTKKGKPNQVEWSEAHMSAMSRLKTMLCSNPVLRLPDFTKTFILRTDASTTGLGAVLLQDFNGVKHPIIYISRKLQPREQKYATVELECLSYRLVSPQAPTVPVWEGVHPRN